MHFISIFQKVLGECPVCTVTVFCHSWNQLKPTLGIESYKRVVRRFFFTDLGADDNLRCVCMFTKYGGEERV